MLSPRTPSNGIADMDINTLPTQYTIDNIKMVLLHMHDVHVHLQRAEKNVLGSCRQHQKFYNAQTIRPSPRWSQSTINTSEQVHIPQL